MTSKRPTRLYKIPSEGKIMGVCAGVADYLGMNRCAVRVLTVLAAFAMPWVIIAYFVLGLALDAKPDDLYQDEQEEEFWRQTRKDPEYTVTEIRRRFRDIERRTVDMEAYMTSKRFRLDRELRSLEE